MVSSGAGRAGSPRVITLGSGHTGIRSEQPGTNEYKFKRGLTTAGVIMTGEFGAGGAGSPCVIIVASDHTGGN